MLVNNFYFLLQHCTLYKKIFMPEEKTRKKKRQAYRNRIKMIALLHNAYTPTTIISAIFSCVHINGCTDIMYYVRIASSSKVQLEMK